MPRAKSSRTERVCQFCGKTFLILVSDARVPGRGQYCSRPCIFSHKRNSLAERLFKNLSEPTETGCRLWLGEAKRGYGKIGTIESGVTKTRLAHRVAWELVHGPIPKGMFVCHKCDTPACCNADHLFLGTQTDNVADKVAKGRQSRGESHGLAQLTDETVKSILSRFRKQQATVNDLAAEYGLTRNYILKIIRGTRWKHLASESIE